MRLRKGTGKQHLALRTTVFSLLLLVLIPVIAVLAISLGQIPIPFNETAAILANKIFGIDPTVITGGEPPSNANTNIVWLIRAPRVLGAFLVGAGLALAGVVMQATVQNPLADPYVIGVSSGASLGAVIGIILHISSFFFGAGIIVLAFIGALGAALLAVTIATIGSKMSTVKLVLAGVVISALCTAIMNFIIVTSGDTQGIQTVMFWMMGSLTALDWEALPLIAVVLLVCTVLFLITSQTLNTLLLGDEAAATLGINIVMYRRLFIIAASLLTAAVVATCGIIGFVGLVIPHAVRALVGSDHKKLIPMSILVGAVFLALCDLFSRLVMPAGELPIGIVTALIGAPFFMYILIKKGYGFGNRQ